MVILYRDPLTHAASLMEKHLDYQRLQNEDPFVLEYMNWLGHHEFGLNHKVFDLKLMEEREKYDNMSMNYWIAVWISYYTYILTLVEDKNLFLIEYSDLCSRPKELLSTIGGTLNMDLSVEQRDPYAERKLPDLEIDSGLMDKAGNIYSGLVEHKVEIRD